VKYELLTIPESYRLSKWRSDGQDIRWSVWSQQNLLRRQANGLLLISFQNFSALVPNLSVILCFGRRDLVTGIVGNSGGKKCIPRDHSFNYLGCDTCVVYYTIVVDINRNFRGPVIVRFSVRWSTLLIGVYTVQCTHCDSQCTVQCNKPSL